MSTLPYWLHLPAQASDAEVLSQVKRALRQAEASATLVIGGTFLGDVKDTKSHGDLIGLILDASIPVLAAASGPIGQRGLALLLAADRAAIGTEAQAPHDWRASPGLIGLLHHRLGPAPARATLFDPSSDILARLVEHGHAARVDDLESHVEEIMAPLGNGLGPRLKRSLRASAELPLKEAIGFDLWFTRSREVNAP